MGTDNLTEINLHDMRPTNQILDTVYCIQRMGFTPVHNALIHIVPINNYIPILNQTQSHIAELVQ